MTVGRIKQNLRTIDRGEPVGKPPHVYASTGFERANPYGRMRDHMEAVWFAILAKFIDGCGVLRRMLTRCRCGISLRHEPCSDWLYLDGWVNQYLNSKISFIDSTAGIITRVGSLESSCSVSSFTAEVRPCSISISIVMAEMMHGVESGRRMEVGNYDQKDTHRVIFRDRQHCRGGQVDGDCHGIRHL